MSIRGTVSAIAISAFLFAAAAPLVAEDMGRCRVLRSNGMIIEGAVKKVEGGYEVTSAKGITVKLKDNEVNRVIRLDIATEKPAGEAGGKTSVAPVADSAANVSDSDVEDILGSENTGDDVIEAEGDNLAPCPANEDSIAEMMRIAGKKAQRYETDHFVLVYTSERKLALELAARMESIYKWVIRYQEMLDIPIRRPDYKLEQYFFGTYKEYQDYMALDLGAVMPGALGFYQRETNRSAFFDMQDEPGIADLKKQLAQPGVDWRQRQFITNRIKRYTDFYNLTVIQHECAHHVHFNTGVFPKRGDMPRWLVEGLACMFELPPTDAGGSLGVVNHARLDEFRKIYGKTPERLGDLRLFIVDDSQFRGGMSYSLGWALHQYMWKKYRKKYAKYMQLMAAREDDERIDSTKRQQEFEDLFGPVDEEWVKKFVEYVNTLQLRQSVLP